jgi:ATP-dependent Lon protease
LANCNISVSDEAIANIVDDYTREAGLRNLEREIANICRKLARICLKSGGVSAASTVDGAAVREFLGPKKFRHEAAESGNRVGVATGLVWTEFGGEIIFVEAIRMTGSQQLLLTGSLGNVLRESAQTALSYIRANAPSLGIDPDFFFGHDIHIHIPAGAIPKDGPSAGVTIAVALISLLTGRPAHRNVALSGEITLNGEMLPVSGIREKILAAQRGKVKTVILPRANEEDLKSLPDDIKDGIEAVPVDNVLQATDLVLQ